jgi:pimeloyl-ACP methyl ester carboxylesterase
VFGSSTVIVAAIAALTAVATGCGSDEQRPTSQRAVPGLLDECRRAGSGWQPLPTSGDYRPHAARLGDGRLGVVFANDSDNITCSWAREARSLTDHGYAVAAFETVGNSEYEAAQVLEVAGALRRAGARRIAVVGASVGARAVLQAAAERPRDVVGVVALSAERRIPPRPGDLLPVGRQLRVPVLTIGSRRDPLTQFGKDTLAWHRTIPDDRALVVRGSRHGVELLRDARVRAAILGFLRSL